MREYIVIHNVRSYEESGEAIYTLVFTSKEIILCRLITKTSIRKRYPANIDSALTRILILRKDYGECLSIPYNNINELKEVPCPSNEVCLFLKTKEGALKILHIDYRRKKHVKKGLKLYKKQLYFKEKR